MTDERWKTLERGAEALKRAADNRSTPYYERERMRREAENVAELARQARQAYVNWLWGYG